MAAAEACNNGPSTCLPLFCILPLTATRMAYLAFAAAFWCVVAFYWENAVAAFATFSKTNVFFFICVVTPSLRARRIGTDRRFAAGHSPHTSLPRRVLRATGAQTLSICPCAERLRFRARRRFGIHATRRAYSTIIQLLPLKPCM